jgi:hypothetical protein
VVNPTTTSPPAVVVPAKEDVPMHVEEPLEPVEPETGSPAGTGESPAAAVPKKKPVLKKKKKDLSTFKPSSSS